MISLWMGRDPLLLTPMVLPRWRRNDMTKEELIEALEMQANAYFALLEQSRRMNETWSAIAGARR